DDKTLRQVVVKQWGIPYRPARDIEVTDAAVLIERARGEAAALGIVPEFVRFLVFAIDVQAKHFEVLVRGYGPGGESTVIDFYRVAADTAVSPGDWDELLEGLAAKRYPLVTDAGRAMGIRAGVYDSGGAPGVTEQAYDAFRR